MKSLTLYRTDLQQRRISIIALLLFASFLIQQSIAIPALQHTHHAQQARIVHAGIGIEKLSAAIEQPPHKVFHVIADATPLVIPRLLRTFNLAKETAAPDFVPLFFYLIYTHFTSTYL